MTSLRTTAIALGTATVLAVPTALVLAPAANADIDKHGKCGVGVYEFSVDREDGGYEVGVDFDRVAPGTRWKIQMSQNGKTYFNRVVRAENDGDFDVDRKRPNTSGADVFRFKASRVGGPASCGDKITVS